jgi:hypothetical protein
MEAGFTEKLIPNGHFLIILEENMENVGIGKIGDTSKFSENVFSRRKLINEEKRLLSKCENPVWKESKLLNKG